MRTTHRLTHRQELFAEHYALSGNGTKAALRAGCRTYNAAHVQANRWLQRPTIQKRVLELREKAFQKLRNQVTRELANNVKRGLETGTDLRQTRRAVSLMRRLQIFDYQRSLSQEIAELEERYGCQIETVVEAMAELEICGVEGVEGSRSLP